MEKGCWVRGRSQGLRDSTDPKADTAEAPTQGARQPGSHPHVPSDQGGPLSPSQPPPSRETSGLLASSPSIPPAQDWARTLAPSKGWAAHPEDAVRVGSGVRRLGGKVAFLVALCTASSSSSIHLPSREPLISSPGGLLAPRESPHPGQALPIATRTHPTKPYVFFSEDVSATSS